MGIALVATRRPCRTCADTASAQLSEDLPQHECLLEHRSLTYSMRPRLWPAVIGDPFQMGHPVHVADLEPSEQQSSPAAAERPLARFGSARYVGGHPRLGGSHQGQFLVTSSRIGICTIQRDVLSHAIKGFRFSAGFWFSSVADVDVIGGQVAKSKVGAVVAFGVLGLGAKGSKNEATLIVRTTDGETAYFTIDKKSPIEVHREAWPDTQRVRCRTRGQRRGASNQCERGSGCCARPSATDP